MKQMSLQASKSAAMLPGQSLPAKPASMVSKELPELAFCASEDMVRKRYNAVMGINEKEDGWRASMSKGVRNMSSTLSYLRQNSSKTHLNDAEIRKKPSQNDEDFAQKIIREEKWKQDSLLKANIPVPLEGGNRSGGSSLSPAALRILRNRGLLEYRTGNASAAKRDRPKRKPNGAGAVFPRCMYRIL